MTIPKHLRGATYFPDGVMRAPREFTSTHDIKVDADNPAERPLDVPPEPEPPEPFVNFQVTRKELRINDDGGYAFAVVLTHDPEWGWGAHASFESHGKISEIAALNALLESVERFKRMTEGGPK